VSKRDGSLNLYTIAPGRPFLDDLAAGILDQAGQDPLALSRFTVLLPTRRACRSLREAFLRRGGGRPMLLPRLSPIGDIDSDALSLSLEDLPSLAETFDLPPAISGIERQLLLARLIMARGDPTVAPDQAAWLAAELGRLIDQVETERLSFDRLADLVPEELAQHWQLTLDFLKLVTERWPEILAERGVIEGADRRNRVLAAQAEAWRARPPDGPVIAAGSTGSIPATADLLKVIAGLPQGAVVLPGLDREMDEESWQALTDSHPQFALRQLLHRLGAERSAVADWPVPEGSAPRPDRSRLIREAMRPAATSDAWQSPQGLDPSALDGLTRLSAATPQEEADVIALMMRATLETPGRTAALVTPDRSLARRVAMALSRWGITVDDSAGQPLADTAVGSFLRLAADCAMDDAAPLALLALLKHPLASGGMAPGRFRARVRELELAALRGPKPLPGFAGLKAALGEERADLADWLDGISALAAPFFDLIRSAEASLDDLLRAHVAFVEGLAAADDRTGAERLWRHEDGEEAAAFIDELREAAALFQPFPGRHYPALFAALMAGRAVRPRYGEHPRLSIWGLLEARLQQADLMILAGLNEGTWPHDPVADSWMSRPMRRSFGLPSPEFRIGQSAHDFAQAMAGPEVVLSRAERVEGAPTVPSRWLLRLDAVLEAAGLKIAEPRRWHAWARALDAPDSYRPRPAPCPRPPVAARPRRMSVTDIATWMADPYAIYARYVLDLLPLDPIEADPGAADRGNIIHRALAAFLAECPDRLPPDAEARLLEHGRRAFGTVLAYPGVRAFWWPRFERIARWFLMVEQARREQGVVPAALEVAGSLTLPGPAGPFELRGRADRVDRIAEGDFAIIDYKTGIVPTNPQVVLGYAPQLPLEAMMLEAGGFAGIPGGRVRELAHWRLSGSSVNPGEVKRVDPKERTLDDLVAEARQGLLDLIARFDRPDTPYLSQPRRDRAPRFGVYDHLARVQEWSSGGEGGE